jgi:hypothetical protein
MPLSPQDVANRWAQGLANATQKMTQSATNLTVAPTQQAADAMQTWIARLNDPKTQAKWQAKLRAVTLGQWQQAYTQKGIPRVSQGAQVARDSKMVPFFSKWLPYEATGSQQVRQMPKATLQDRIARAVFMINYNSQFTYP